LCAMRSGLDDHRWPFLLGAYGNRFLPGRLKLGVVALRPENDAISYVTVIDCRFLGGMDTSSAEASCWPPVLRTSRTSVNSSQRQA